MNDLMRDVNTRGAFGSAMRALMDRADKDTSPVGVSEVGYMLHSLDHGRVQQLPYEIGFHDGIRAIGNATYCPIRRPKRLVWDA